VLAETFEHCQDDVSQGVSSRAPCATAGRGLVEQRQARRASAEADRLAGPYDQVPSIRGLMTPSRFRPTLSAYPRRVCKTLYVRSP